jgi:DNA gyrase subunit A
MGGNTPGVTIFRGADQEHVVSVAKIEESDVDEVVLDGGGETAPEEGAVVGEGELDKPADPSVEE